MDPRNLNVTRLGSSRVAACLYPNEADCLVSLRCPVDSSPSSRLGVVAVEPVARRLGRHPRLGRLDDGRR